MCRQSAAALQDTLQAPDMRLLGQAITSESGLYYVALTWCLLVTIFMLNLRRTALGRALVAVREKDYAAAVIGVHSFRYKLVAFATLLLHRRRQRRCPDLHLLPGGNAGAVRDQCLDRVARAW